VHQPAAEQERLAIGEPASGSLTQVGAELVRERLVACVEVVDVPGAAGEGQEVERARGPAEQDRHPVAEAE
jgi:hypothetical protein